MLKKIAIALALLVLAVLGYAATKPDTFHVERTASMKAAPEKILPLITDFKAWANWSPYEKLDPTMKKTYGGAASGKGATYNWSGEGHAGEGRMEIIDVVPTKVTIKLDFSKPFQAHNIATFTLTPKGDSTDVTWAMDGPSPYISKLMTTFFNMDTLLGNDFEAGLASMKVLAEK